MMADGRASNVRRTRLNQVVKVPLSPAKEPLSLNFCGVFTDTADLTCQQIFARRGSEFGGSAADDQSECGGADPIIDTNVQIFRDQKECDRSCDAGDDSELDE
jgi:hypothetical protein